MRSVKHVGHGESLFTLQTSPLTLSGLGPRIASRGGTVPTEGALAGFEETISKRTFAPRLS